MRVFRFLLTTLIACASVLALGQPTAQQEQGGMPDYLADLTQRISIHGFIQGGYAFSDQNRQSASDFVLKRSIVFARAQITDRWSFQLMHDFSSVVQEFYTDYRLTRNAAMTVRVGQFKNSLTMENPIAPTQLELIDLCSQSVTCLSGGYDPLMGLQYGRDLGMKVFGQLFHDRVAYEVALMNGQGVNRRDGNADKDVIAKVEVRPVQPLRLVVSAQKGRGHAVGKAPWNPTLREGDNYRRDRFTAGAEWKSGRYAAGKYKEARPVSIRGEYLLGRDGDVDSRGAYLTTSVPIVGGMDAVASVDYFDRNTAIGYRQTQATAGVQYWFYRNCRVQLQYTRTWSHYQPDYNWLQGQLQVAF